MSILNEFYKASQSESIRTLLQMNDVVWNDKFRKATSFLYIVNVDLTSTDNLVIKNVIPSNDLIKSIARQYEVNNKSFFLRIKFFPYINITLEDFKKNYITLFKPDDDTSDYTKLKPKEVDVKFSELFNSDNIKTYVDVLFEDNKTKKIISIYNGKESKWIPDNAQSFWSALKGDEWTDINTNLKSYCEILSHKTLIEFYDSLKTYIRDNLNSLDDFKFLWYILTDSKEQGISIYVSYDIENDSLLTNDNMVEINNRLNSCTTTSQHSNDLVDIMGNTRNGYEELVKKSSCEPFKSIGGIQAYASNKDIPCQTKYGMISSDACCIGNETRQIVKMTIEELGKPQFEHYIWNYLDKTPNAVSSVFAYPTNIDDVNTLSSMPLAEFLGASSTNNDELYVSEFETIGKSVLDLLNGQISLPNTNVNVMVVEQLDKGRINTTYNDTINVDALSNCATEWKNACHNLPDLIDNVKVWDSELKKFKTIKRPTLYISTVWKFLNTIFTRGSDTEFKTTSNIPICKVYDLFFNNGNVWYELLNALYARSYFKLAQDRITNREYKKDDDKNDKKEKRADPIYLLSIFALLLYKGGYKMVDYKNSLIFKLGEYFAEIDNVQSIYNRVNKFSPQRGIGNSMMMSNESLIYRFLFASNALNDLEGKATVMMPDNRLIFSCFNKARDISNSILELGEEIPDKELSIPEKTILAFGYNFGKRNYKSIKTNSEEEIDND